MPFTIFIPQCRLLDISDLTTMFKWKGEWCCKGCGESVSYIFWNRIAGYATVIIVAVFVVARGLGWL